MKKKLFIFGIACCLFSSLGFAATASQSQPEDVLPKLGDISHGNFLHAQLCPAQEQVPQNSIDSKSGTLCSLPLDKSGLMNLQSDQVLYNIAFKTLKSKTYKPQQVPTTLSLDAWDIVAALRNRHLALADFFPQSKRYIVKEYSLDSHGEERIVKLTQETPIVKSSNIYVFFSPKDMQGNLSFVPQDPMQLEGLKKKDKDGYLVFLPFSSKNYQGEIGISFDAAGKIITAKIREENAETKTINAALKSFSGLGKMGQDKIFSINDSNAKKILKPLFSRYLTAMELSTRYIVEERDRTMFDDDIEKETTKQETTAKETTKH